MGDTAIMQRTLASKSGRQDVWLATSCPPASHMWVPGGQRPGYQLSSSESPVAVRPYVITPCGAHGGRRGSAVVPQPGHDGTADGTADGAAVGKAPCPSRQPSRGPWWHGTVSRYLPVSWHQTDTIVASYRYCKTLSSNNLAPFWYPARTNTARSPKRWSSCVAAAWLRQNQ